MLVNKHQLESWLFVLSKRQVCSDCFHLFLIYAKELIISIFQLEENRFLRKPWRRFCRGDDKSVECLGVVLASYTLF